MTDTRRLGMLLALATAMISGVSVYLNADAVRAFSDATTYTTAKNVVAATVLLTVFAWTQRTRGWHVERPKSARQWAALSAVGAVGGSVPFVLFFEGLARADSGQAAFLHKTLLIWVGLLAIVVLRERVSWVHGVAVTLLVVGQIGLAGGLAPSLGLPEALILAATLLWSVEVVLAKRLLGGLSSHTVALARMGVGSIVLIAWAGIRGNLGLVASLTATQLGWVALTGALLAGYVATWFAALKRAQAIDVTAVLVLGAPITAVLNNINKGIPLDPTVQWLVLTLAGGALVLWAGSRRTPQPVDVAA
jgi:drug/metabolite transporter (DMT)-like permease